jgi:endonuclease YncB( thermonuclease family)
VNGRALALVLGLTGTALGLVSFATSESKTVATTYPVRSRLPQLAADSVPPAFSPTPTGLVFCTVSHIVDGDTIDVNGCADAGRIRLILVNTPEISPGECFGKEASAYTSQRLLNRQVGLEKDRSEKDSFGRYLRYVWTDGELFNERLVRDGYAELAIYPPDLKHLARIAAAQAEAKSASRGLWPACGSVGLPGTPTPKMSATPTSTPSPTPPGTATPAPTVVGTCSSATAEIIGLDKVLETVTISGSGNLSGWYLVSLRGSQRFDFPANFTLNGTVQVRSAVPPFTNSASQLWWSSANQWNNSEDDDAVLYNCMGQQVSYFDDGE